MREPAVTADVAGSSSATAAQAATVKAQAPRRVRAETRDSSAVAATAATELILRMLVEAAAAVF
jgi:hypothetical protein